MVFQDGGGYIKPDGNWRVPVVFDNLIHKKQMPVTIGIFINPGVVPALSETKLARFNRSFEYDGLGEISRVRRPGGEIVLEHVATGVLARVHLHRSRAR